MSKSDEEIIAYDLRVVVNYRLIEVGIAEINHHWEKDTYTSSSKLLMNLFGYTDYRDFCKATIYNEEVVRKMHLLAGQHTYSIYMAMKANKE